MPAYKIGSDEVNNLPLIRHIAHQGRKRLTRALKLNHLLSWIDLA